MPKLRRTILAGIRKYKKQLYEIGVYGILNTITGKWYIGSSILLSKRMGVHLRDLRKGTHHSTKLQRSYNKHGETAFEFRVLLTCSKDQVEFFENRAIKGFDSYVNGYNVAPEAKGGFMRGKKWKDDDPRRAEDFKWHLHTEETKAKIRRSISEMTPEAKALKNKRIGKANSKPKSKEGAANIARASFIRLHDPTFAKKRSEDIKKAWVTRRANQLKRSKNEP